MIADCTPPAERSVKTNKDLALRVDDWATAYDLCNDGRATLRDWAKTAKESP